MVKWVTEETIHAKDIDIGIFKILEVFALAKKKNEISDHIQKIYSDSELEEPATIRKFRIVQTEGSRQVQRETNHYNLQIFAKVQNKMHYAVHGHTAPEGKEDRASGLQH